VGKALCSLVGGVRSWRASLPSFASVDLVGARPLSAKQPLEDSCLHRPALALLGGVSSRLLAQPALRAEPVFSSQRHGDSWDASRQIARPLACPRSHPHDTSPQNWRSLMGLHGASVGSFPRRSLVHFRRSPRILCPAWRLSVSRPSLVKLHRPSRDVPAPRPIRLATAERPRAGTLPLGTCAALGSDPTLRPAQCDSDLSCHLDFGVTTIITSRVIMRGGLAYVSGTSHQFPP
jgi:hypothetical protein